MYILYSFRQCLITFCVCMCMLYSFAMALYMEVRRQKCIGSSLLLPLHGLNSGHQACEASTVTCWAIPLTLDHWFDPWEPYSGRRKWKSWKNTNLIQMFLIYSEVHIDSVHPKLKTSKVKHALKTLISYKKLHGVLWLCCLSYPHDCMADWKQRLLMLLVLGGTVVLNVEKEWK